MAGAKKRLELERGLVQTWLGGQGSGVSTDEVSLESATLRSDCQPYSQAGISVLSCVLSEVSLHPGNMSMAIATPCCSAVAQH